MSPTLQVNTLSAGYRRRKVIDKLTLAPIPAGTVTALVGPNGAGKSTLLRALAGFVPAKGALRFGDRDLLRETAARRAQTVGLMPQSAFAGVTLTVLETVIVALKTAPAGGPSDLDIRQRALDALARVGIADLALQPVNELSGGQRQLANLAQTIARGQEIILLDEPTSALDLRLQMVVMKLVAEIAAEGRMVVVVLHDLNLALQWADRLIVLGSKGLRIEGPPREAITPELLAEVYGVRGRIEACSRGIPRLLIDAAIDEAGA